MVVLASLYALWYFQPYNSNLLFDTETLLSLSLTGHGSSAAINNLSTYVFFPLLIVSFFGLWFFWNPARLFYTLLLAVNLIALPFTGLSVQTGIDLAISQIVIGCEAIILFMCYFSQLSEKFKKQTRNKKSPHNKRINQTK